MDELADRGLHCYLQEFPGLIDVDAKRNFSYSDWLDVPHAYVLLSLFSLCGLQKNIIVK